MTRQEILPPEPRDRARVIWRKHPFAPRLFSAAIDGRKTVAEYIEQAGPDLPFEFERYGTVTIDDEDVPRELWARVRPRDVPGLTISLHSVPRGDVNTATILGFAVLIAATLVTAGFAAPLLGSAFAAGTIGAKLAGLAIAVAGSIAVQQLTPPPVTPTLPGQSGAPGVGGSSASLQGNVLRPGAPVPMCAGPFRIFPPLAVQPLVDVDDRGDEVAEAVYILAGVHEILEPQLGEVPIAHLTGENTEYEQREGDETDTALTLVTRYGRTEQIGQKLARTQVQQDDNRTLTDQSTPLNSVSKPITVTSLFGFDEFWITLDFPVGMSLPQTPNQYSAIPIRIRFQREGDTTWRQLPEIHVQSLKPEPRKCLVKIIRGNSPGLSGPQEQIGPVQAWVNAPMRVEVQLGNLTGNGLNDGALGVFVSRAINPDHYFGANWVGTGAGGARMVNRVHVWPRAGGVGFNTNNANLTFEWYRKSGTAPANSTDGTLITSTAITDGTTRTAPIVFTTADFTDDYTWVRARRTDSANTPIDIAELQIYGDWRFSLYAVDRFRASATVFDNHIDFANSGSANVQNANLGEFVVSLYLDTATYPQDVYTFEILRGGQYQESNFTFDAGQYRYNIGGAAANDNIVCDFFTFVNNLGEFIVAHDYDFVAGEVGLVRYSSVRNAAPVTAGANYAKMAIKTKQQADRFSVLASAKVFRWNGVDDFDDFGPSTNPADHLFAAWCGTNSKRPLPVDLRDLAALEAFWDKCDTQGYTINAVFEGKTVKHAARIAAACGYAIERESELFGVILGRDRSLESTTQQYTYRNVRGFRVEKRFTFPLPSAFRIPYRNAARNYLEDELIVFRPGAADDGVYETVNYEGFVSEADIIDRALFDWRQALYQSASYHLVAPLQWLRTTKGDTCALAFDRIADQAGSAYIESVTTSAGNITGFVLDGTIQTTGSTAFGILIRCLDGTTLVKQVNAAGETRTITVTTPFANPGTSVIDQGCLVLSGPIAATHKRVICTAAEPRDFGHANMVFVDDVTNILFGGPSIEFIGFVESATPSGSTHTFTSVSIGAVPDHDCEIVIAVGVGGSVTISSATLAGNPMTFVDGEPLLKLFQIQRPLTGTTANIAITATGTPDRLSVGVFLIRRPGIRTPYASESNTSDASGTALSVSIAVPRRGAAIVAFKNASGGSGVTWTNATEVMDDATEGDRFSSAIFTNGDNPLIASRTFTATGATNSHRRIVAASWR